VLRAPDGSFYLYHTGIGIWHSTNLVDWTRVGNAFTREGRPQWEPRGGLWAPDVRIIGDKVVMYYAMSVWGGTETCGVGRAIAQTPAGPFTDLGPMFRSGEIGVKNSIDPCYFEENGHKYLFWGSYGGGIWAIELTADGLNLLPGAEKRRVAADNFEGVFIHRRGAYYYLFASINNCCDGLDSKYTTVVGRSDKLFGPYFNRRGERMLDGKYSVVIHNNDCFKGTGHNSGIITDSQGTDWIMYHSYEVAHPELHRQSLLDRVSWVNDWPVVEGNTPSLSSVAPVF
jgi:arabinan endo-1,5-alpha-L-arabinosidase